MAKAPKRSEMVERTPIRRRQAGLRARLMALALDPVQVYADVWTALLDAMTDTFHVSRDELDETTVPSKDPIGADQGGWRLCLARFEKYLYQTDQMYQAYHVTENDVDATLNEPLSNTAAYFTDKILRRLGGL